MWKVPKMWEGGECWIIGGGHSVPRQFDVPENIIQKVLDGELPISAYSPYLSAIHQKHIIGVNIAYLLGNWVEIVFFGDNNFYFTQMEGLAKFPGLKITCNPNADKIADNSVKRLGRLGHKGISNNPSYVCWNGNSGAAAISVAANAGAKRIILLGFDMKLVNNEQHWHRMYKRKKKDAPYLPFHRHIVGFPQIAKDARRMGIEILNASPDSAIEVFRKVTVKEILDGRV